MRLNAYTKWITPIILIIYVMASVAFWMHHMHHAAPAHPPASAPTHP